MSKTITLIRKCSQPVFVSENVVCGPILFQFCTFCISSYLFTQVFLDNPFNFLNTTSSVKWEEVSYRSLKELDQMTDRVKMISRMKQSLRVAHHCPLSPWSSLLRIRNACQLTGKTGLQKLPVRTIWICSKCQNICFISLS